MVARTVEQVTGQTINIPRILVVPKGEVKSGFKPFTLELESLRYPAVSEEQKAPKAVVIEKAFDFGTVMEGDTITHSFKIANHGDGALSISKVQPG